MKTAGFTIIEILVAISVLAVVALTTIPAYKKYNETQTLQNASLDLVSTLKTAQTNTQSGIKCTGGNTPNRWAVVLSSGSYQLECFKDTSQTITQAQEKVFSYKSQITMTSLSQSGYSCVVFSQNNIYFTTDCSIASASTSAGVLSITLSDSVPTPATTKIVNVEQGGAIYVK